MPLLWSDVFGENIRRKKNKGGDLQWLRRFLGGKIKEMIPDDGAHQIKNKGHRVIENAFGQVNAKQRYNG